MAPNAPADQPLSIPTETERQRIDAAVAPYIARARAPEADVLDWLITKPDESEEGNFVGKFLDTYRP